MQTEFLNRENNKVYVNFMHNILMKTSWYLHLNLRYLCIFNSLCREKEQKGEIKSNSLSEKTTESSVEYFKVSDVAYMEKFFFSLK